MKVYYTGAGSAAVEQPPPNFDAAIAVARDALKFFAMPDFSPC
jgi:hypothetical protein